MFIRRVALCAALLMVCGVCLRADDSLSNTFPLSDVQPGMKGYMETIFSGDEVERVDLQVIGVMHNALGPKQDVILVRLLGDKVAQSGVVAGMSGSPVYFDGKLAGALSLKLGSFTREAIGGVTPIAEMMEVEKSSEAAAAAASQGAPVAQSVPINGFPTPASAGGQTLVPIATPLISTGLYPQALTEFNKLFSSWGMSMSAGGSAEPKPNDPDIKPGDMVAVDLVRGDLSLSAGCTVTAINEGHVLACGHPIFNFGQVTMGLSRAHVLVTLASQQDSSKIIDTGGLIGTLTEDRQTAIMGKLGAGPAMIPVHLTIDSALGPRQFSFEVVPSSQLTAQLVALATFNGISGTPDFGGGKTLALSGTISIKDHSPVNIRNSFAATDATTQTGLAVALDVQGAVTDIFSNPYEIPHIENIDLHVKESAERHSSTIDSIWSEKTEAHPGDTVVIKALLRPYRGQPFVQEIPITIPAQTAPGTVAVVVSDAAFLNRTVQLAAFSSQNKLPGLEELIGLVNRERRNDRLYATLVQATPTLLVDDKEMPNVPASAINVLDERPNPGGARLQIQSAAGEWSVDMNQVIAGQQSLSIAIK